MRALIQILGMMLAPNDPRWSTFGLTLPSVSRTPGRPQNVVALAQPDGVIAVSCDAVPTATRYRWRMKIEGVDVNFRLAASTLIPSASLTGIAPGQVVAIIAQAVNGDKQGAASDPVVVAEPKAALAAPSVPAVENADEVLEEKIEYRSGQGHSVNGANGHANGNGQHELARRA